MKNIWEWEGTSMKYHNRTPSFDWVVRLGVKNVVQGKNNEVTLLSIFCRNYWPPGQCSCHVKILWASELKVLTVLDSFLKQLPIAPGKSVNCVIQRLNWSDCVHVRFNFRSKIWKLLTIIMIFWIFIDFRFKKIHIPRAARAQQNMWLTRLPAPH